MTVISYRSVTTVPGEDMEDPFCPPAEMHGATVPVYLDLMHQRIEIPLYAQRMLGIGRFMMSEEVTITGLFAPQAKAVLEGLGRAIYIDTSPGCPKPGPFSPHERFTGKKDAYLQLIRRRYKQSLSMKQEIEKLARYWRDGKLIRVIGPYKCAAIHILNCLSDNCVWKAHH